MKKSMLLSLATVGAVVMTSAATFAAWDTLDVKNKLTLNYADPVVVSMEALSDGGQKLGGINGTNELNVPVKIDLDNYSPKTGDSIVLSVVDAAGAPITPEKVNIVFKENGTALTNGTDTTVTTTNEYTASVSVKDGTTGGQGAEDIYIKAELKPVAN